MRASFENFFKDFLKDMVIIRKSEFSGKIMFALLEDDS